MQQALKALIITTLIVIFSASSLSCATSYRNSQKKVIHRAAFVKIEKTFKVGVCIGDECNKLVEFDSTASGSIIKNRFDGSYILTAAHVCDSAQIMSFVESYFSDMQLDPKFEIKYKALFTIITIEGKEYPVNVVAKDNKNDICILWVEGCNKQALAISPKAPVPGDRAYNIAAPLGIFYAGMAPLQEGLYDGEHKNRAFYSIPAIGGSSGSPIVNHKGELIGMVHSTYRNFNHLSISPTYADLISFIKSETEKHISLHMIDIYMRNLVKYKDELEKD